MNNDRLPASLRQLIAEITRDLARSNLATPALDARLLVQSAFGLTHAQIIGDPHRKISQNEFDAVSKLVARRLSHEPVSRITGTREFYGRDFSLSPHVLDPRPDTEVLIEQALFDISRKKENSDELRVLDLGCGSGAIILTLLAETSETTGVAVDVSQKALSTARENATALGLKDRCEFIETAWCNGLTGRFDIIVSNPPYIRTGDIPELEKDVRDYDPGLALDGGKDGLEAYRKIASEITAVSKPGTILLLEVGAGQAGAVVDIFSTCSPFQIQPEFSITRDLAGHERVVRLVHPDSFSEKKGLEISS